MTAPLIDTALERRARFSQGAGIMRIVPSGVARPTTMSQLRQVLDAARTAGLAVTPRGAGTAMDGSNIGAGVVLDMSGFEQGRCVIDAPSRHAHLTPSTRLGALRTLAGQLGLRLPPEPSSAQWATLGGMVSTNAAGARSVRYGSVRPWVTALTLETRDGPLRLDRSSAPDPTHAVVRRFANHTGPLLHTHAEEIARRFPRVRKNSAGYALDRWLGSDNLIDLVIGSEGTLGVITDLVLRLDPVPASRGALQAVIADRAQLQDAIASLRPFHPSTIEFLDASFLDVIRESATSAHSIAIPAEGSSILLADFEADTPLAIEQVTARAGQAIAPHAARVSVAVDAAEIERLWAVRHGASPALAALDDGRRSLQVVEDGCVPDSQLLAYIEAVETACRRVGIDVVIFGHAGDGHVHVNLLPDLEDPAWLAGVQQIYRDVSSAVVALGGTPSGEHGAGRLRAPVLPAVYGATIMACFAAVKDAFDPDHRFNPGVILGDANPFATLKLGSGATAIPGSVSTWLDDIERRAAWDTGR